MLQPVAEQKYGYTFGKPLRADKNTLAVVLPIIRVTSLNRDYITFPETEKVLVFDIGRIDEMEAENQSGENVFVRSGTLFKGSTQERALQRSAVLFPGKKSKLSVRCVHASRGINPSSKVTYGGVTPLDFDAKNYAHGYTFKDQHDTWANVQSSTAHYSAMTGKKHGGSVRMRSSKWSSDHCEATVGHYGLDEPMIGAHDASAFTTSGSDDLHSSFTEFAQHFDDVLSKVKRLDDQAGLALITHAGVQTVEFFDHQLSWKALHEAAVKRLGSAIVDKGDESVFDYKPEKAVEQVNRVLGLDWKTNRILEHRPSNGEPRVEITGLTAEGFVGEAVEVGDRLIHLVVLKTA